MDTLLLKPYIEVAPPNSRAFRVVRLLINGVDLIDWVCPIEQQFEPDIAGHYMGPYADEVFLPCLRLLGSPQYCFNETEDKTDLLQCPCGFAGCWSLMAKITLEPKRVIWSDFENNHRPEWDYSKLGPFIFEREQYEAALKQPENDCNDL